MGKLLDKKDKQFKDEYFPQFNSARSKLRQVRNELRKLAGKTVYKTRNLKNLLAALEKNKKDQKVFLGAALKEMKSLMISSKKILDEALEEYNLTIEAFKNLNSAINDHNQFLKKLADSESKEFKEWERSVRGVAYGTSATISAGIFGGLDVLGCFGFCSLIGNPVVFLATAATVESTINAYKVAFGKFEKLTDKMVEKGKQIDNTLQEANAFLNSEIELIVDRIYNVEQVSKNIDSDPEEVLRKYAEIRTIFNEGLDDLQKTAQEFLNREEIFVQKEDNDNDINNDNDNDNDNDKDDDDDDDVDDNDDDDDDERILLQGNDDDDIAADDDDDETLSIFVDA